SVGTVRGVGEWLKPWGVVVLVSAGKGEKYERLKMGY
nr:hypothetical protein [Tanacetum cinerariifolium]